MKGVWRLVLLALLPLDVGGYPRHLVWNGTMTTTGSPGMFVARTHLRYGRDIGPEYDGHFRCRGVGCVARRGHFQVEPGSGTTAFELFLFYRHGQKRFFCAYVNDSPPPDFAVDGPFTCVYLGQEPQPVIATGVLALAVPPRAS